MNALYRAAGVLFTVPLIFFLPGYSLARGRPFKGDLTWIEKLLLTISLSVSAASLVALLTAEVGFFRIWLVDVLLAAISAAGLLLFRNRRGRFLSLLPKARELAFLALLILLCLLMFFRPAEYVMGEGDPEIYFNIAYNLSRTGRISIYEPSVREMSEAELNTFYYRGAEQFFLFHLRDRAKGRIQPLVNHLLPVWMALFSSIFGKLGGLYVLPVFALLGVLAVYAIARRLAGLPGALVASLLSATCFLWMWFARIPNTEVFAAFPVLASFLFFMRYLDEGDGLVAFASALSITAASLARPEALLFTVPMLLVVIYRMFAQGFTKADYLLSNTLLAGAAVTLVYIRLFAFEYVSANFGKALKPLARHSVMNLALLAGGALVAIAFVFYNARPLHRYLFRIGSRVERGMGVARQHISTAFRAVLSFTVLAAFFYLYRFTPTGTRGPASPRNIFTNTAATLGGVGVFVFVAGLCLLIFEARTPGFSFLLAFAVVTSALARAESSADLGLYPWFSRQYMVVVIPLFFVGFAYLFERVWELKTARRVELRTTALLVFTSFLIVFLAFDAPVLGHRELAGTERQLAALSRRLEGKVVIFTNWYSGETVAMPLRYQYGVDTRKVFDLSDARSFAGIIKRYDDEGRKVLIEMSGVDSGVIHCNRKLYRLLQFEPAFDAVISYPRMFPTQDGSPGELIIERSPLKFYYVTPRAGSNAAGKIQQGRTLTGPSAASFLTAGVTDNIYV